MFVELLNNAVYLLALGVIYDVLELRIIRDKQSRQALTGIFIGLIGIVVMLTHWEAGPGVYVDTRMVLLGLCGLFLDRKSTRLNSSHNRESRMPSSA